MQQHNNTKEKATDKLKAMDLEDPFVRRYAEESIDWISISRVCGDLGVSRAIGDADFKQGARMKVYDWAFPNGEPREFSADLVSSDPDVTATSITPEDRLIIVACDGLWEVFTSQQAVELAQQYVFTEGNSAVVAMERIIDLALKLGCSDNVTGLIILLPGAAGAGSGSGVSGGDGAAVAPASGCIPAEAAV